MERIKQLHKTEAHFMAFREKSLGKKFSTATLAIVACILLSYTASGIPPPLDFQAHTLQGIATSAAFS